jgi:SAM-dependent methyltransferase
MTEGTAANPWQRYWSVIGDEAVPPWDSDPEGHTLDWCARVGTLVRGGLPLIDVACGNGNQTWWLAERFAGVVTQVVGIDVSPAAVRRARRRPTGGAAVRFEVVDILDGGAVEDVAHAMGPANVWVRFLLHLLDDDIRRRVVDHLDLLTGGEGRVLDYELLQQPPGRMETYAERHPTVRAVYESGIRPAQLAAGRLPALYREAGMAILATGREDFVGAHGATEGAFPCEWVVVERHGHAGAV